VGPADFAVVGAGVMGVNIASELKRRHPEARVRLLEKEDSPGLHASGRNSGVLHAGFYYSADSLKARFTRAGNRLMREYCVEKGLRVNRCGKLVVARDESELPVLAELLRRGRANDVALELVDEREAVAIEPRARTFRQALFSPSTATVDPLEVMRSFVEDARRLGVELLLGCAYTGRRGRVVRTRRGDFECGFLVNAAGLHADTIARDHGFSERYRILPFKGLYLYSSEPPGAFRTNLYPVPNLRNPFLGVHVTVTADGRAKLGPTAIPCLWREQYGWLRNFSAVEFAQILGSGIGLAFRAGFDFRGLALEEMRKYHRPHLVGEASRLATGIHVQHYARWGRPGIRAQLVDLERRILVQDFCLAGDDRSLHVLNAVSPGWTCALPFSRHVCDRIEAGREGAETGPGGVPPLVRAN
jgi:L-2-hydroxyglutarate oxidase LhgO